MVPDPFYRTRRVDATNNKGNELLHGTDSWDWLRDLLQSAEGGQPLNEILMDLHNNAVGRDAGRNSTPVNPGNLQTMPYYGYPYQGVR